MRLDGALQKIEIGTDTEFLKDDSGKLTIADITDPKYRDRWFKTGDQSPRFGWTKSVIWARISVANETDAVLAPTVFPNANRQPL